MASEMSAPTTEGPERRESLPDDDEVLAAVSQTGFLLERQVHDALKRHGFTSSVGVAYSDPETDTHREIDVVGTISSLVEGGIPVFMHVLIECKKWSSGPLVGIGGAPTPIERHRIPPEFKIVFGGERDAKARIADLRFYHDYRLSISTHPVQGAQVLATQLVLMERKRNWVAQNTAVYDSVILPLVKAQRNYSDTADMMAPDVGFAMAFTRSALVTTAPLRGVVWINDEKTKIVHPKFFPVVRNFSSKDMPNRFTFEVVSAEHLDAWLSTQVVPFFAEMCRAAGEWLDDHASNDGQSDR